MKPFFSFVGLALAVVLASDLAATSATTEEAVVAERRAAESAKANVFFDRVFDASVDRSPISQGYLGLKKDHDKWDDFSEANQLAELAITVRELAELQRSINFDLLDEQAQMSYRLFVTQAEQTIEGWKWRNHGYVFNQMDGMHADAAAFLINFHAVDNIDDARAYVTRLRAMPAMFDQLMARAGAQAARGILPPRFVYPMLVESCREILSGAPFEEEETKSALWEDFGGKVSALKEVDEAAKAQLLAEGKAALLGSVRPAYEKLIALFAAQEKVATDEDGVWKLPEGEDYYNFSLR
ncbi:MAG TPA: DUF885 family protein, partial [Lacunisphaera sp.]|nr:DUF885 family protein [Lacunisphaera sp.]